MSLEKVEAALMAKVAEVLTALAIPTAGENLRSPKKDGDPVWAQVWFNAGQPYAFTMGTGGEDRVDGYVQIDLMYPDGSGNQLSRTHSSTILAAFSGGTGLTYQGQIVTVRSCGRSQGLPNVGNCYKVPITIMWWALIPRGNR